MVEKINWELEAKRARRMSVEALRWSIQDAREALECAEQMEREGYIANSGKYADQIHTYNAELNRRLQGGKRRP
jgi:hypothetical protein